MTDLEQFLAMLRRGIAESEIKIERGVDMSMGGPMFPKGGTTVVTVGVSGRLSADFWFAEEPVDLLHTGHREAGEFFGTSMHAKP